ncbi:MAG: CBS domain-containing protein [Dehalococcoidia bacterium]
MARVKEFMTRDVVTVDGGDDISQVARLMRDHDIGVLPVMDGRELKGVVTDRDLVIRALAEGRTTATAGELVSGKPICLAPDDDENDAQKLMSQHDVRRLPVMDGGKIVGMVSVGDIAVRASDRLAGTVMEKTGPHNHK